MFRASCPGWSTWLIEHTRLQTLRTLKENLNNLRYQPSFSRLNGTRKGAYPVQLAPKHSVDDQQGNTAALTLTWAYYSSMPTHPNPKLMLYQSRTALKQTIILNMLKILRSLQPQRQCFIGANEMHITYTFWGSFWILCIIGSPFLFYNVDIMELLCLYYIASGFISSPSVSVNTQFKNLKQRNLPNLYEIFPNPLSTWFKYMSPWSFCQKELQHTTSFVLELPNYFSNLFIWL
jgi:hypothetical protein